MYTTENDLLIEFPDISNLTYVTELFEKYPSAKLIAMQHADSSEHLERALILLNRLIEIIKNPMHND